MVVATQMSPIRNEKIREIEIPVIDLSGKESEVSKLIVKACEEYGFFKVINHGVPHHIIKTMEEESLEFFSKPLPEKQLAGPANPYGYGNKNIGLSGDTGELEYLLLQTNHNSIANSSKLISSHDPSKFSCAVSCYIEAVRGLACEILELMAKGLGLGLMGFIMGAHQQQQNPVQQVFSSLLTHPDTDSLFRLNHYPPVAHHDTSSFHGGSGNSAVGFGEHTDPQILTLLRSNGVPGLQISLGNGVWAPVPPDPLSFFVNVGDVLQAITNGRFVSVRHRAMANSSSNESRLSMVFFGGPPPHAKIICPPEILKEDSPLYKPFTWADYKSHTYAHRLGETRLDHFKIA